MRRFQRRRFERPSPQGPSSGGSLQPPALRLRSVPRLTAVGLLVGLLCLVATRPCVATEETSRFLNGLRHQGWHELAFDYLEQMRDSQLASDDFKAMIDYESGVTLIASSRTTGNTASREKKLDRAQTHLEQFLAAHGTHPVATRAESQLAHVQVERGKIKLAQASDTKTTSTVSVQLRAQARSLFQLANDVFTRLDVKLLQEHQEFDKFIDKRDKKYEQRLRIEGDILQTRLALCEMPYLIARTYEPGSEQQTQSLGTAAKKSKAMSDKYQSYVAGQQAKLLEGRCYAELGAYEKSLDLLSGLLLLLDESPQSRNLKNKTLIVFLETASAPEAARYKDALLKAAQWEKASRGDESSTDGLRIKLLTAEAALKLAASLDAKVDQKAIREHQIFAKQSFEFVARFSGRFQKEAKLALRRPVFVGDDYVVPEPTDFTTACDRAHDALAHMQGTDLTPQQVDMARNDAKRYFQMALGLRDDEVSVDDANVIRYYLAWLHLSSDEPYEAAVIGNFLARRYPKSSITREGARIAMQAHARLFDAAAINDRDFEKQRMVGIAQYIATTWNGESAADEAWVVLINTALGGNDLEEAQQYLAHIPANSPRRSDIEMKMGQRLWVTYRINSAKKEGERPDQETLDAMRLQARALLEGSVGRLRDAISDTNISYTLLASVLSLAQIELDAGAPDKAAAWIADPKVGPLRFVVEEHAATSLKGFRMKTYRTALRAFVAAQRLDEAEVAMQGLESLVRQGNDSEAAKALTQIYIRLGLELKGQLERLRSEQKTDQLQKVATAFERFLDQIAQREEGNSFASLNWVASTFFGLGTSFSVEGATVSPEAKGYYLKAAQTYQSILSLCSEEKIECQPGATDAVRIRLATCLRHAGKYPEALSQLLTVLKKRPTMVSGQIEAAYTYQAWGDVEAGNFLYAIKGSTKYSDVLWGWGRLAARLAQSPKHRTTFHEARYNLALCRFRLAMSKSGSEKAALLDQAAKDISVVQRLYPELGGAVWRNKYLALQKKIARLRPVRK